MKVSTMAFYKVEKKVDKMASALVVKRAHLTAEAMVVMMVDQSALKRADCWVVVKVDRKETL